MFHWMPLLVRSPLLVQNVTHIMCCGWLLVLELEVTQTGPEPLVALHASYTLECAHCSHLRTPNYFNSILCRSFRVFSWLVNNVFMFCLRFPRFSSNKYSGFFSSVLIGAIFIRQTFSWISDLNIQNWFLCLSRLLWSAFYFSICTSKTVFFFSKTTV